MIYYTKALCQDLIAFCGAFLILKIKLRLSSHVFDVPYTVVFLCTHQGQSSVWVRPLHVPPVTPRLSIVSTGMKITRETTIATGLQYFSYGK